MQGSLQALKAANQERSARQSASQQRLLALQVSLMPTLLRREPPRVLPHTYAARGLAVPGDRRLETPGES